MDGKLKSMLIVSILILSALVISTSFGSIADAPPEELGARGPPGSHNYTWMPIEIVSEPVVGQNINTITSESVRIAVENDHIYVVWDDNYAPNGAGPDRDILYRHFDGNSWSNIEVISEPVFGQNINVLDSYDPSIAVDGGNVYVIWEDANNTDGASTDYDIFYRCNRGSGWEDIQVISEPEKGYAFNTGSSGTCDIDVENGQIYVVWQDYNQTDGSSSDQDVHFVCNLTGTNWEEIQVISEPVAGQNFNSQNSYDPLISVYNKQVYVLWEDNNNTYGAGTDTDIFVRCNLTGSNWEAVQVVSEPAMTGNTNTGASYDAGFAAYGGNMYAVWEQGWNYNGNGGDEDIFYRCNITGIGWESIQVISEPIPGQNFDTASEDDPKIAAENGMVCAVWGSSNNTNGAGTDNDVAFRISYNGVDWESIEIVNEPDVGNNFNTGGGGNYPWVEIDDGRPVVAWFDQNNTYNSGTDNDVYVRKMNLAPEFFSASATPTSGNTSTIFNFTVTYSDQDNDKPKYIKVGVSGKSYVMNEVNPGDTNHKNGKDYWVEGTHLNVKTHNTKFFAGDGWNVGTYWLNGEPVVVNTPPEIITNNDKTAPEDALYEVDYEYEDMDFENVGQVGTWSLQTTVTWLSIDPDTGVLSGTPTQNHLGSVWVNVTIDDGRDIDWTRFQLTVTAVNDAPTVGPEQLPDAIEDENYNHIIDIGDEETPLNGLDYTITTNAEWLNVNKGLHSVNGTPLNEHVGGDWWVKVNVDDSLLSTQKNYNFTVINTNDAPEIITEDITTAMVGKYYVNFYEAIDVDPTNDTLKWSVKSNAGTWLQIDKVGGWLHGTPGEHNYGTFWVDVTVTDGMDSTIQTFDLTIKVERPPNQPPMIITDDITNADVNVSYSVLYEAVDDRTPPSELIWTMTSNGTWLNFNATSAVLSGKPVLSDVGTWWVNITVADTEGGSDYQYFIITIEEPYIPPPPPPPNNEPELTNGKIEPDSGSEGTTFTFSVHYSDEDGDPAESVTIVVDGEEHEMERTSGDATEGDYEYKTKLPEGTHAYYFKANDGQDDAVSGDADTPTSPTNAQVSGPVTGSDEKESDLELSVEDWSYLILLIIVIIIVVMLFLTFALVRKKPKTYQQPPSESEPAEEEFEEDEEDEWDEE